MRKILTSVAVVSLLSACATGQQYQANVYRAGQTDQAQNVKPVVILGIQPAKIEVPNTQGKQAAMVIGGILGAVAGGVAGNQLGHGSSSGTTVGAVAGGTAGAAAGSLVGDTVLVDGVQITFKDGLNMKNSAQVGRLCEFKPGDAMMVFTTPTETRIQPNNPGGCKEATKS